MPRRDRAASRPTARVIDLTHGIPRHDVRPGRARAAQRAALHARRACTWRSSTPRSAPSAAPSRCARPRTTACSSAPTTACSSLAAERFGGVVEAVEIGRSPWRLEPVSPTFHGRDIFAPVAAGWPPGEPLAEAGDPLDPAELVGIELPRPRHEEDGKLVAHVLGVDRFGNVALDVSHEDLTSRACASATRC